jgi:hypothetical protein
MISLKTGLKFGCVFAVCFSLSGCMSNQRQPTPEELAMQKKVMEAFMGKMNNGPSAYQPQVAPAVVEPTREKVSKADLITSIESLPSIASGVSFERKKDGIKINGKTFLDPEGEIVKFGSNNLNGDFTYIIKTGQKEDLIKYGRAGSNDTVTLGYLVTGRDGVNVETVTGKKLSGNAIIPTSRGFVISRKASAFKFDPLNGVSSFSSKDGFHVARFQNGDVASSGFILLEKDEEKESESPLGAVTGLFGALKDAGNAFGVIDSASYEYMLADLDSDAAVPLDITTEGKKIGVYSNCRKKNAFVNDCANVNYKESLYNKDGSKNLSHYYWKVYWFNTPEGPFAIAQEAGLRKVTITNMKTGEKVIAFERMLGINGFDAKQSDVGVISLSASLGFSSDSISDAVDFFNKNLSLQAKVEK